MLSRVLQLPAGRPAGEALRAFALDGPPAAARPHLVLAFLPPDERLASTLAALAELWPAALRLGCEAATQFTGGASTAAGCVHLMRFEEPAHTARVEVVAGTRDEPPDDDALDRLSERIVESDATLLLVDGLRFPTQETLARLRRRLAAADADAADDDGDDYDRRPPTAARLAGGLASQPEPVTAVGARVFSGTEVFPSACLALHLSGVGVRVEVVRGWDPASPVYRVTRAEGNVLWEIDGEPATRWYRRFFEVDGELAPMPESAWRFPLIVEGPAPERSGLYRSMRFYDQPPGAVTFWGDLEPGDRVRLGMGNDRSLVRTAGALAPVPRPEAAVLFSCVGRERVLGDGAEAEIRAVHRALGEVPLSGFFSFAEIGPSGGGGPAFYNQTAILVLLREAPR